MCDVQLLCLGQRVIQMFSEAFRVFGLIGAFKVRVSSFMCDAGRVGDN